MFYKGNPEFLNQFKEKALSNNLIIMDFFPDKTKFRSQFDSNRGCIYISKEKSSRLEYLNTLYHEVTHFLDYSKDNYLSNTIIQNQLLEIIKKNNNFFGKGLVITYFGDFKLKKYLDDKFLNQKWMDEIKSEKKIVDSSDFQRYLLQKKQYEGIKYQILIKNISDIYDAILNGLLRKFGGAGHGEAYYFNNENKVSEIIANLGAIFNLDGTDILIYEFGEKIANELIKFYQKFLSNNDFSNQQHKL